MFEEEACSQYFDYAFGSLMRSKFVKNNAWNYLLLQIEVR